MFQATLLLAALPLVIASSAHNNQRRVIQQPGLIRFPITVSEAPAGTFRRLRRQSSVDVTSQSTGFFYTIDLVIGTPGQTVPVNFDTGSWELWVNPSCTNTTETAICESLPRFTESTTLVDTNQTGQIAYGAGYAKFKYMYDHISVGGAKINQQIFGVAYDTSVVAYGILGAGPWVLGWKSPFPHVLDSLVSQNHIQSRAFSLDLRPIESPLGAVIFGGIDTRKYIGSLEKRPIASGPDGSVRYWIYVDGLSVTREDGSQIPVFDQTNGLLALLDSGHTLTFLPRSMVTEILKAFPSARQDPNDASQYIVDCSAASLAGTVNFKFGTTTIKVPYDDFLWKQPQHGICVLGVSPNDSFFVLGDTFLRSAYAVYDMDNRNVHLASAADCGTNLVPIGKGTNAVPSLIGECSPPATSARTSTTASSQTQDIRATSSSTVSSPTSVTTSSLISPVMSASASSSLRSSSSTTSSTPSTTSSATPSTTSSATPSTTSSATPSTTSSATPSTTSSATPSTTSSATPSTRASTTASTTEPTTEPTTPSMKPSSTPSTTSLQTKTTTTENVKSTPPSSSPPSTSSSPLPIKSSTRSSQSQTTTTQDVNASSSAISSSPTSLSTASFTSILTSTPTSSTYSSSTTSEAESSSSLSTTSTPTTDAASSSLSITASETQHSSILFTSSIISSQPHTSLSEEIPPPHSSSLSTSHFTSALYLSSTTESSSSSKTSTTSGSTTISSCTTNKVPVSNHTIPIVATATLSTRTTSSELTLVQSLTRNSTAQVATEISSTNTPTGNAEISAWQSSYMTHTRNNSFTVEQSAATESPDFNTIPSPDRPSKVTVSTTLTVTSCEPTVSNCPVGKLTTSIVVLDATSHLSGGLGGTPTAAGTTAIYTLPAFICGKGAMDCTTPTTLPTQVVTVVPLITKSVAVTVGDCVDCEGVPTPLPPSSHQFGFTSPTPGLTQLGTQTQGLPVQECSDCSQTLLPPSAQPETSIASSNDAPATHTKSGEAVSSSEACLSCSTPTPSVVTAKGVQRPQSSAGLSIVTVGLALLVALVRF